MNTNTSLNLTYPSDNSSNYCWPSQTILSNHTQTLCLNPLYTYQIDSVENGFIVIHGSKKYIAKNTDELAKVISKLEEK